MHVTLSHGYFYLKLPVGIIKALNLYQAEFLVPVCYCASRVWNHGTCITKAVEKNKSVLGGLGGGGGGAYGLGQKSA